MTLAAAAGCLWIEIPKWVCFAFSKDAMMYNLWNLIDNGTFLFKKKYLTSEIGDHFIKQMVQQLNFSKKNTNNIKCSNKREFEI